MMTLEDRLRVAIARAEAEARYWREAYFAHMKEEHPEVVGRVNAKGEA